VDAKHRVKKYPSQESLKERFDCGTDGKLIYTNPPKFLPHLKGTVAGGIDSFGYLIVRFDNQAYKAHRLVWIWHFGEIPEGLQIDHIDRNKSNNSLENLRVVPMSVNMRNRPIFRNNTSGVEGVHWVESKQHWRARAMINSKRHSIGDYKNLSDAKVAVEDFKKRRAEYAC
jgi:hypothetical protein